MIAAAIEGPQVRRAFAFSHPNGAISVKANVQCCQKSGRMRAPYRVRVFLAQKQRPAITKAAACTNKARPARAFCIGVRQMATAPMMDEMGQQPAGMSPDTDPAGSTEICIQVAQDGGLSVYTETAGAGGEQGEMESQRQPAADIGEALRIALQLYKSLGQGADDQQFDAGFGKPKQAM